MLQFTAPKRKTAPSHSDLIPSVNDDETVKAAAANLRRLRDELKTVETEAKNYHGRNLSDPPVVTKHVSVYADAEVLLDGGVLQSQSFDTAKAETYRLRDALRKAVELAEQKYQRVHTDAASDLMASLTPVLRPVIQARRDAWRELLRSMRTCEEVRARLRKAGFSSHHLLAGLPLHPKEEFAFAGGNGMPSLAVLLQWFDDRLRDLDNAAAKRKKKVG